MKKQEYKGHVPLKRFGQNFIKDNKLICKIIKFINLSSHDLCIEIGPGLGELTQPLSNIVNKLFLIEIDSNLVRRLRKIFSTKNIIIFEEDVLHFDFLKIFNLGSKLIRVIGNLPYNISTKFILNLFKYHDIVYDIHIMLQEEVADRLLAKTNSSLYGRLSIITQYYCDIEKLVSVSPISFFPKPKVRSCFIRLLPKRNVLSSLDTINVLSEITKVAFQQRRKILRTSLSKFFNEKDLVRLDINPFLRAQNLSVLEYYNLANYLIKNKNIKN